VGKSNGGSGAQGSFSSFLRGGGNTSTWGRSAFPDPPEEAGGEKCSCEIHVALSGGLRDRAHSRLGNPAGETL